MSGDAATRTRSAAPGPDTPVRRRRREAALIVGLVLALTMAGAFAAFWQPVLDCGVLDAPADAPAGDSVDREPDADVVRAAVALGEDLGLGALLGARTDRSLDGLLTGADTVITTSGPRVRALQPGTSLLVPQLGLTVTAERTWRTTPGTVIPAGNRVAAIAGDTGRTAVLDGQLQIESCGTAPTDVTPLATNGRLLLATTGDDLVAFDLAGERRWRTSVPGGVVAAGFTRTDAVAVGGDGTVVAFGDDGGRRWRLAGPGRPEATSIGERGVVVASADRGAVIDIFGEPVWEGPLDAPPRAVTTAEDAGVIITERSAYRVGADERRVPVDDVLTPVAATTLGNGRIALAVDAPGGRALLLYEPDE